MIDSHVLFQFLIEKNLVIGSVGLKKIETKPRAHGVCCYCQDCGYHHDECVCEHNSWVDFILREDNK